ncbi:hypothetical protein OS175_03455 [Marinicella sp. S1101]|uniref:hypothetical protein n=1 Tax=Marinicella marina TaxID=2996016 RepID=UPI002260DF06|nr:hypothetical protein [Marinicella marina]MCX7552926.1 hypothetical protein [Marinicella marina]MDJ1139765.1 hypothetical protein [Marinicella marina]
MKTEDQINSKIRESMNQLTDSVDPSTVAQLHQIRQTAQQQKTKSWLQPFIWQFSSAAAALVLVFAWFNRDLSGTEQNNEAVLFADLDMLTATEDADFYADLEFLTWLDENNLMENEI